MAQNNRRPLTAEDKKNGRIGCVIILAGLLLIGGCNALINDNDSSSSGSSSSSSYEDRPKQQLDETTTVTVQDFVGMGLQEAQDAAQADGIYMLDSTDAAGLYREQLWDRNWTVCAQTPAAGETMTTDDTLTFDTVKSSEGETCDGDNSASLTDDTSGLDENYTDDSSTSTSTDNSGSGDDSSSTSSDSGDDQKAPAGATAQCNDGTYSYSQHRRGTCSHHNGVAIWLASVPS